MLKIREIRDIAQLTEIEDAWNDLLTETPGADFFRTSTWLKVYWQHFGANQRLRILVIEESGQITGILPFCVSQRKTRLGQFRVLGFPLDYWGSFYGPIGADPVRLLRVGVEHIVNSPRNWDILDLRWLHESHCDIESMQGVSTLPSCRLAQHDDDEIAVADLSAGWDEYWSSRSGNWRSNCRRNAKKANAAGEVECIRYRPRGAAHDDADPRWDLYDAVQEIARKSWQGSSQDGTTMTHESVQDFLRDMHVAAANTGGLDLMLMKIDGQPVAFNYNYHYRGYVSSLRLGFDAELSKAGIGTTLTWRMLEDSAARGDRLVDFLPGSLSVKRPWQTSLEASKRLEHIPTGFGRTQLLRAKRWLDGKWQSARASSSLAQ